MTNATENPSPAADEKRTYTKSRRVTRIQRRGLDPLSGNIIQKFLKKSIDLSGLVALPVPHYLGATPIVIMLDR